MGLDTSHDCFHGSYSGFMRFRLGIFQALGFTVSFLDADRKTKNPYYTWDEGVWKMFDVVHPGLSVLMRHSDCDGVIEVKDQLLLATELEALAEKVGDPKTPEDKTLELHGYGLRSNLLRFAAGLRAANAAGENVEFH